MSGLHERAGASSVDESTDGVISELRASDRATIMRAVGAEVKALRHQLNLNQKELAQMVGLSYGMMSKIEHGRTTPSVDVLVAIADRLGVPVAELFSGLSRRSHAYHVPARSRLSVTREGSEDNFVHQLLGRWQSYEGMSELYHVSSEKDGRSFFSRQSGVSFIYMLSGKLDYRHGDKVYRLKPGDTLCFDAACVHGPDAILGAPISYLMWRHAQDDGRRAKESNDDAVVVAPCDSDNFRLSDVF